MSSDNTARIRQLNDLCRQTWIRRDVFMTPGVQCLGTAAINAIAKKVQTFDAFTPENDPNEEHDFGAFEHAGILIYWKQPTSCAVENGS